ESQLPGTFQPLQHWHSERRPHLPPVQDSVQPCLPDRCERSDRPAPQERKRLVLLRVLQRYVGAAAYAEPGQDLPARLRGPDYALTGRSQRLLPPAGGLARILPELAGHSLRSDLSA